MQTQFPRGSSLTFNRRLMSANGRATATKFLGKEKGGEGSDNDDETKSIPAHKGNSVYSLFTCETTTRRAVACLLYSKHVENNTLKASFEMLGLGDI